MESIVTDRLIIRKFVQNDWRDLYEYLCEPIWLDTYEYAILKEEWDKW